MKTFRVTVMADKWPSEYIVQASGWGTAINRAVREWQRRFKGSRTKELKVRALKGGDLLVAEKSDG